MEEHLPEVWADRDRLLQVFENLIGNAIKSTARGGSIVVGGQPQGGKFKFYVRDTGSGIGEEDVPRLFDRFWQADHTGRRGTVWGCQSSRALSKRMAAESGSKIRKASVAAFSSPCLSPVTSIRTGCRRFSIHRNVLAPGLDASGGSNEAEECMLARQPYTVSTQF